MYYIQPQFKRSPLAVALATALALSGCGGGSDSSLPSSDSSTLISGSLIDGPIAGATVFLDLNNNQQLDSGEPESNVTDADGRFQIDIGALLQSGELTVDAVALASLVSIVPDSAYDADDAGLTLEQAGRSGFTLVTPMEAYVDLSDNINETVVSPLTTLVAGMVLDDGLTLAEAKRRLCDEQLGLDPEDAMNDPMVNYIETEHHEMHRHARTAADTLAESGRQLRIEFGGSAESEVILDTALSARDQFSIVQETTRQRLRQLREADAVADTTVSDEPITLAALRDRRVGDDNEDLVETLHRVRNGRGDHALPSDTAITTDQPFIVLFDSDALAAAGDDVDGAANELVAQHDGAVLGPIYRHLFEGFAVTLPADSAANFLTALNSDNRIRLVENETATQRHPLLFDLAGDSALWGLDVIDGTVDGTYQPTNAGDDITIYIADTGVLDSHTEFDDTGVRRVLTGYSAIEGEIATADSNGHGTHVAGIVGGDQYGVARSVELVPVQVLNRDGAGRLREALDGLDWIAGEVAAAASSAQSVVNISWGSERSTVLDLAVSELVAQGVPVVVAAGNSGANACRFSPAAVPAAITVGAALFDADNNRYRSADYSNSGPCLDLYAPGSEIRSAYPLDSDGITNDSASEVLSGTSMAAPHVTGALAQLITLAAADGTAPTVTPAQLSEWLIASSATDRLDQVGYQSPNRFLQLATALPLVEASDDTAADSTLPSISALIADLQGSARRLVTGWRAEVRVTLIDSESAPVVGAEVGGDFSIGGSASTCLTDSNGSCYLVSGILGSDTLSVTFTPTTVSGVGITYDAASNAVSEVTINDQGGWERHGQPRRPHHH